MAESAIEHVVVLMLENRSFDHMLGFLDHPNPLFPNVRAGAYSNLESPADSASARVPLSPDAEYTIALDPPHSHESAMQQLNISALGNARMDGFIAAYARKARGEEPLPVIHWWRIEGLVLALALLPALLIRAFGGRVKRFWPVAWVKGAAVGSYFLWRQRRKVGKAKPHPVGPEVMRAMAPERIPVLGTLAKEFAVCTRWHCSVPGETWPNRNFVHAATSEDSVDIEPGFYEAPTIFEVLERHGATWRVYHDGKAQLWAFWNLWRDPDRCARWDSMDGFEAHVAADDLASYSFIEPSHEGKNSNSQHPNNNTPSKGGTDFVGGEALIARIYNVLRAHPDVFAKTMFVITYDEHGGLYDHVPPPTVAAPVALGKQLRLVRRFISFFIERGKVRFRFRLLGPRVPAVIVSPRIPAGTVDDRLYDHSSVVTTLRHLFAPRAGPLTARDGEANGFDHLASLSTPRPVEDLPDVTPPQVAPATTARAVAAVSSSPVADEFSMQLEVLAAKVGAELDAGNLPTPPSLVGGDGAGAGPRGDVAQRFSAAAARARGSSS